MADKNLSLTGESTFELTANDHLDNIYNNAPNMNDDNISTKVGFYGFKDTTGHYLYGSYNAIIEFARIARVNKIEFHRYWQMTGGISVSGYEKTYLYYNNQWNLIDTRNYVTGSGTGTIEITSGAPWSNVTKVKLVARMERYTIVSQEATVAHYLYELRAWGTTHKDIGLRLYDGSSILKIGCQDLESSHKLRVRKGGTTYGIELLDVDDVQAKGIRIYDGSAVKALPIID